MEKIKNRCLTQGQPKMTAIFLCFRVQSCFIFSPVKTLPEMLFPTSVKQLRENYNSLILILPVCILFSF